MIVIIVLVVLLSLAAFCLLILSNQKVYIYVFEHKMWKLWKYYIYNADCFKYSYKFNGCYIFTWNDIHAIVWPNGFCSIHKNDNSCIVGIFYKEKSSKMAKMLISRIKE